MSNRYLDSVSSRELLLKEMEQAGWSLWFTAKRGDRTVSGPTLDDVVRRALESKKKS